MTNEKRTERAPEAMRPLQLQVGVARHAEGSCEVHYGNTRVLCAATLEQRVPAWLRGTRRGWVTGAYGMLPRATDVRVGRNTWEGGRAREISRLVGRALRGVVVLGAMGEQCITVDCDVLEADGGTRTAAITGGWVALKACEVWMRRRGMLTEEVVWGAVAGISCGVVGDEVVCDLDYKEDSSATVDANFAFTEKGEMVEAQASGEKGGFTPEVLADMVRMGWDVAQRIMVAQREAVRAWEEELGEV